MKCNCKTVKNLSFTERERLKKEIIDMNEKFFRENYEQHKKIICNNLFKVFCIALNNSLKIGGVRIEKVLEETNKLFCKEEKDFEDFWIEYDKQCQKILGKERYYRFFKDVPIKFDIEKEKIKGF